MAGNSIMGNGIWEAYQWLDAELLQLIGQTRFSAEINLRLERITQLLELLGNPHCQYRSIHVGGTSGKGSTTMMIANILHTAGYKTGLHQSPHIQILNERHWINGQFPPTSQLVEVWKTMKPAIAQVAETSRWGAPSYFEAQMALSFLYFAQEAVDVAVIEVGLGGARDATNVIPAEVAVLTNVGLDHTAILGDTVEEIVLDKRGIIKPGQHVISGCTQPSVQGLVAEKCIEEGANLYQLERDFSIVSSEFLSGQNGVAIALPEFALDNVEIALSGKFQQFNAALATMAVTRFDPDISETAIRTGLANITLAARMEVMQQQPLVLLDGAHNPDKIRGAAQLMAETSADQRVITVLSLKAGKDATDILPSVLQQSDVLLVTGFQVKGLWEPIPPIELANQARAIAPEKTIETLDTPIDAVEKALEMARAKDIVWITGSLYLAGDVREYWYPSREIVLALEKD